MLNVAKSSSTRLILKIHFLDLYGKVAHYLSPFLWMPVLDRLIDETLANHFTSSKKDKIVKHQVAQLVGNN
jgi:hypothetical protein